MRRASDMHIDEMMSGYGIAKNGKKFEE